jgi:hypothetical protein
MTVVSITDTSLKLGADEISDKVSAWRLDRVGRDVPTLVLELVAHEDIGLPLFEGYANVRVAMEGPTVEEFLNAVDAGELEAMVLERDDLDRSGIAVALDILREMAPRA